MKLYSYSSELLTFVNAKWVITKFIFGGICMVTIILVGVMKLNQSVGNPLSSRSVNTLTAENNFLRQQVSQILPRVSKMEIQAAQLNERANNLVLLLHNGKSTADTVSRFTNATKDFKLQSLILAAESARP